MAQVVTLAAPFVVTAQPSTIGERDV